MNYYLTGKEPDLHKLIIISAVLHLFLIAIITIPVKMKKREYITYTVSIVRPSEIQPAIRSTKKKTVAKKPSIKVKPTPRRRIPKKGVTLDPDKVISREIQRLMAIRKLQKQKETKAEEEEIREAIDEIRKKARTRLSIGPVTGRGGKSARPESYAALIIQKIQSNWIHPVFETRDLEAIVSFRMDKDGNVISYKIEKSSGNKLFDHSAVRAILKSSPLPPHPVEREIEVRFHL